MSFIPLSDPLLLVHIINSLLLLCISLINLIKEPLLTLWITSTQRIKLSIYQFLFLIPPTRVNLILILNPGSIAHFLWSHLSLVPDLDLRGGDQTLFVDPNQAVDLCILVFGLYSVGFFCGESTSADLSVFCSCVSTVCNLCTLGVVDVLEHGSAFHYFFWCCTLISINIDLSKLRYIQRLRYLLCPIDNLHLSLISAHWRLIRTDGLVPMSEPHLILKLTNIRRERSDSFNILFDANA